jgi:hypothetical protein
MSSSPGRCAITMRIVRDGAIRLDPPGIEVRGLL